MEDKKTLSKGKKIIIAILAVLMLVCVIIDVWYLVIYYTGDDRVVSNTYEVGLQETVDGDTKYFIEINYMSNKNNNGLEMFEIKFNYLLDEQQESFYSQGLQYVANNENENIEFLDIENLAKNLDDLPDIQSQLDTLKNMGATDEQIALAVASGLSDKQQVFSKGGWYNAEYYYALYYDFAVNTNSSSRFNYMSANDYETPLISTNPIDMNSIFRIQLDDELYQMQFKGRRYQTFNETEFEENVNKYNTLSSMASWNNYYFNLVYAYTDYFKMFPTYDADYFAYLLYNAVQSLPAGTNKAMIFEFGDMFNYYEHLSDGQYQDTAIKDTSLLIEKIKSYYSIKVNISADGARKVSDSIFNCVKGSTEFSIGEIENEEYFTGKQVVNLDIYDFELVNVRDNYYALKLKDEFNAEYLSKASKIYLSISIDLDVLNKYNYEFAGFTKDSGLEKYSVHDCYTTETINGQVEKVEVEYA